MDMLELDNLEQTERLNGRELTAELLNELFGENYGPVTNHVVRGYGIGVEWLDVPGIQTTNPTLSLDVASLRFELQVLRAEIIKLTNEAALTEVAEKQSLSINSNGRVCALTWTVGFRSLFLRHIASIYTSSHYFRLC